jgi:hypothetical protein
MRIAVFIQARKAEKKYIKKNEIRFHKLVGSRGWRAKLRKFKK